VSDPQQPSALPRQFASFALVGAVGFAIDASLFLLLTAAYTHWHPYAARAVSAACSITATWALNRRLTFSAQRSARATREYVRYVITQVVGLTVNLGVFAAGVALVPLLRRYPIGALILGASLALIVNFVTAKHIAFKGQRAG
jgi:putative flippase GtrA